MSRRSVSTLGLNSVAGFTDTIGGFALGDVIDLNGMSYTGTTTTFSFDGTHDRLAVTNGSSSITLQLTGSYNASSFALFSDNGVVGITHT